MSQRRLSTLDPHYTFETTLHPIQHQETSTVSFGRVKDWAPPTPSLLDKTSFHPSMKTGGLSPSTLWATLKSDCYLITPCSHGHGHPMAHRLLGHSTSTKPRSKTSSPKPPIENGSQRWTMTSTPHLPVPSGTTPTSFGSLLPTIDTLREQCDFRQSLPLGPWTWFDEDLTDSTPERALRERDYSTGNGPKLTSLI